MNIGNKNYFLAHEILGHIAVANDSCLLFYQIRLNKRIDRTGCQKSEYNYKIFYNCRKFYIFVSIILTGPVFFLKVRIVTKLYKTLKDF